jgi:hypothetical protein
LSAFDFLNISDERNCWFWYFKINKKIEKPPVSIISKNSKN